MQRLARYLNKTLPRRRVLHDLGKVAGGCVVAATVGTTGCRDAAQDDGGPTSVPLADVPAGQRVIVRIDGKPVELQRKGDRVIARSLVCTHIGCVVRWTPDERLYICPCHQGRFDEDGQVVDGPPTRPLREIAARVSGAQIVLDG
jgi:Rieske Fe-S protein